MAILKEGPENFKEGIALGILFNSKKYVLRITKEGTVEEQNTMPFVLDEEILKDGE